MNLCLCLISYVNTNLKCIMDLNVKAREIMLDNVKREIMLKAWAEQRLLRTWKEQTVKEANDKLYLNSIKIEKVSHSSGLPW